MGSITEVQGVDAMQYSCSVVLADDVPFSTVHKCTTPISQNLAREG
jgi:hypothetical protein